MSIAFAQVSDITLVGGVALALIPLCLGDAVGTLPVWGRTMGLTLDFPLSGRGWSHAFGVFSTELGGESDPAGIMGQLLPTPQRAEGTQEAHHNGIFSHRLCCLWTVEGAPARDDRIPVPEGAPGLSDREGGRRSR